MTQQTTQRTRSEEQAADAPRDCPAVSTTLLVDGHVHVHDCYDWKDFLDSAAGNFASAGRELRLREAASGCLLLTESAGAYAFRRLRDEPDVLNGTGWEAAATEDDISLVLRNRNGMHLLIIAGRQIVTAERLEVLALGCDADVPDGQPIEKVIADVASRGAVPVIPWGFGKWWGRRGRIVRAAIESAGNHSLLLGDNGGRPRLSRRPPLFALAEARGMAVLPGSDPLPFAGQAKRPGSYGFVLRDVNTSTRPGEAVIHSLRSLRSSPQSFGRLERLDRFAVTQSRMRMTRRKRKARNPRALVIAPQPFFSPRGTPFSVYYRTLVTAQLGVEVDLLTYGEGEDVDIPGVRIIRIPRISPSGQIKIGPSLLKLFLDHFFMVDWTIALLLRRRYDFVHAHEEAVFWCRFLKPIFRFKLVYDMHSSLPQQLTNFRFTTSRLLIGLFERLERTCLRSADAVITICPDLENYALSTGIDPKRHLLIENSIFDDVRVVDARDKGTKGLRDKAKQNSDYHSVPQSLSPSVPQKNGPLIVYAGTFEPYQGLDVLIRAFSEVTRKRDDAHLLMVGGKPKQVEQMKHLAEQVGLNGRCTFTGTVSKSQAMAYSQQADVLVSPRREGTNTPLKVYEQLASGKPLVATRIWSHTQVLNDDVCFLVDPEPASMAEGIVRAIEDNGHTARIVEQAKRLYETHYSRPAYEAKMKHLLEILR